jgi:thiol:disulfide interchange protein DsbA
MAMHRRGFTSAAAGLAGALALAGAGRPGRARAQGAAPVDGRDYLTLGRPLAVPANGRIEVMEFFWYGCPHCFAFEPAIEPWIVQLPADVHFARVPVGFDARRQLHQRIYYTWEALGVIDQMHVKTFMRFHVQRKPIDSLEDMLAFAQENGLDAGKVRAAWNGFSMQARCLAAQRLEDAYDIQNTPEMAVAGRFTATPQGGEGYRGLLATTDWLLNRVRHGG